jgi:glycosyltransferase involved in cell wall biosynthesis
MGDITVILNVYNRPYSLEKQLEAIKNQTIKVDDGDIWIWYNKGTAKQSSPKNSNHRLYVCNQNTKFHGRFAIALLARTEYVAMLDDDVIPGTKWFENCIESMKTHNGIMGGSGVTLKSKAYEPYIKHGWNGHIKPEVTTRVDLVGHAWFFRQEWVKYMWYEKPVSWDNGEDIMFSFLCQKYGRINTFVPPHPISDMELWSNNDGGVMGSDANATYIHSPTHVSIRNKVCSECIDRGWKTVENIRP